MLLYYTLFFRPVHERKRQRKARDGNVAEEDLKLRKIKGYNAEQHGCRQHSRNKYFVSGENPQADYNFYRAEGVQEHPVGQVALHERRKVPEPRVRVAGKRGERRIGRASCRER